RTVFRRRPHVDSALVAFRRTGLPAEYQATKRLVVAAFSHRRKTLANSLALAGHTSREDAVAALTAMGLPANVRAERLAPPHYLDLTRLLCAAPRPPRRSISASSSAPRERTGAMR